ncbi:MAG: tetratricopeptide repeat protein [Burkholderiales bacterium]|nr:tetratricopeptide repeat protein [Burkholderiales bacterium]
MLAAGMAGDRGVMLATKAAIDAIPKPAVGDHNLAREKEKSALIAFKEGSYEAAIVRLNEAKKADPSDAELRTNLGYALIAYERLDDAKNVLVESIALDPGRGAAWVALGLVLAKQGDPDSAAAAFISSVAVSEPRMNSVEYFKALSKSDEDSGVKLAAAKALESRIVKEAATIAR